MNDERCWWNVVEDVERWRLSREVGRWSEGRMYNEGEVVIESCDYPFDKLIARCFYSPLSVRPLVTWP